MPQVDYQTSANWQKAAESSNFGTRKLTFLTILMDPQYGLATNYLDNNSTFYKVIQRIQSGMTESIQTGPDPVRDRQSSAGSELFWVGTPRFTLDTSLIQPRATGTVAGIDNTYIYINGRTFSNEYAYYGMSIQFAEDLGAITAGTTYYLRNWSTTNNQYGSVSVLQVSDTFTRENYNTKSTGSTFDTTTTSPTFTPVAFKAGGYDPIDFTDIQPNFFEGEPSVDRGWDCLTIAIAADSDLTVDCGRDPACDYDNIYSLGVWFALFELFNVNNPYELLVLTADNEYGIFSEQLHSWY
jgi:hypothetical protein